MTLSNQLAEVVKLILGPSFVLVVILTMLDLFSLTQPELDAEKYDAERNKYVHVCEVGHTINYNMINILVTNCPVLVTVWI